MPAFITKQLLIFLVGFLEVAIATANVEPSQSKPQRLSILVMIPFTGGEPRDGKLCRAVNELVAKIVNSRRDILPNYHLELDFEDEGANSMQAVKRAVDFTRRFETINKNTSEQVYPSLVAVGPNFSLGCQRYGAMVQFLGMATVATSCLTPIHTANRVTYRNMYRQRISGEFAVYPRLRFIKKIGGWKQIALLVYGANWVNYQISLEFIKASRLYNVSISWIDIVADITDTMLLSLKASNLRIIVVEMVDSSVVLKFMCLSYKLGIRGSKYVFIFQSTVISDPNRLSDEPYPGCSRFAVAEQSKISFWIGGTLSAFENNGKTILGYDGVEFDRMLDEYTNKSRTPDYDKRHVCHDCLLQAILTLDAAERKLQARNLSLRDFLSSGKSQVASAVNESAGAVDYVGLRIGRTKYSPRLEMDYENQVVLQWSSNTSFYPVFKMFPGLNSTVYDIDNFVVDNVKPLTWMTKSGLPPKEALIVRNLPLVIPKPLSITIDVLACLISVGQSVLVFLSKHKARLPGEPKVTGRIVLFLGCLCLNGASVAFCVNLHTNVVTCYFERALATIGLSVINGMLLFAFVIVFQNRASFRRSIHLAHNPLQRTASSQATMSRNVRAASITQNNEVLDLLALQSRLVTLTMVFVGVNLLILTAWFTLDSPIIQSEYSSPTYNEEIDTLHAFIENSCTSIYEVGWVCSLVGLEMAAIAATCFLAYDLRRSSMSQLVVGLNRYSWILANETTLMGASVLMMVIVSSPTTQRIILAFTALGISASLSFVLQRDPRVPTTKTSQNVVCSSRMDLTICPASNSINPSSNNNRSQFFPLP